MLELCFIFNVALPGFPAFQSDRNLAFPGFPAALQRNSSSCHNQNGALLRNNSSLGDPRGDQSGVLFVTQPNAVTGKDINISITCILYCS